MEKICIARRRNGAGELHGTTDHQKQLPPALVKADQHEEIVSVSLSPEQCRQIQSNAAAGGQNEGVQGMQDKNGKIVFNFHFKKTESIKMLKPEHVCMMLQIGKGSLSALVKGGELKSYRIGRMRRFLLTDVMDYLERCEESYNLLHIPVGTNSEGVSRSRPENYNPQAPLARDVGVVRLPFDD